MTYKKFLNVVFCMLTLFTVVKSVAAETTIPDGMTISNSCSKNIYNNISLTAVSFANPNSFDMNIASVGSGSYYFNSSFIPVKSITSYIFTNKNDTYTSRIYYAFYDSNYKYISNTWSSLYPRYIPGYSNIFTTPDNASYLCVFFPGSSSVSSAESSLFQIEEGTTSTYYVDYEECSVVEPDPEPENPSEDNTSESITIDYSISYVIAVLLSSMFLYKFLEPLFSRKG